MKKSFLVAILLAWFSQTKAQDYTSILATGMEASEAYTKQYLSPGAEALVYSINNGWFSTAEAKPVLGFEVSFIGNIATIKDEHRAFNFDVSGFEGLMFEDGTTSKEVASILGVISPDVTLEYTYVDPSTGASTVVAIKLPESLTNEDVFDLPSGYLQASIGVLKGTEVKFRVFPNVEINDYQVGLIGFGVQHEFTKWLSEDRKFPIAISGLVAYSAMDAAYDLDNVSVVEGSRQRVENKIDSWLFQSIFSTKLPVINFYAGLGYVIGNSHSNILGDYEVYDVQEGQNIMVTDPLSVENDFKGVRATLGTRLKLGFFRLHADYSIAEFNTASVGMSFGLR
ncbi:DUF6588 family protein [Neptunitalea lumnitzerae]|uniref:Outer membrane protein beta-barrel domain-containing protein n=1 Tax=Neptunitalea lumnitzerae TaxID=2965509 RepID=A0ABQ5MKL2_9FLAO|nr:DUF6588 family protein [Neptunitalea sp. Y10]GLB49951.1 hypothetical protein Y10_23190 [Neptunitalea sp. Y10]